MDIVNMSNKELLNIKNNTPSFTILRAVETELLKRKVIRKSSFDFFDKLGTNLIIEGETKNDKRKSS